MAQFDRLPLLSYVLIVVMSPLLFIVSCSPQIRSEDGGKVKAETTPAQQVVPPVTKPNQDITRRMPQMVEDLNLFAYQLVLNPFEYKNKLVDLNPNYWPQFMNRRVTEYSAATNEQMRHLGFVGLRFNRMIAEDIALYDCMGADLDVPSNELKMVGQLFVSLPAGFPSGPSLDEIWQVEPLGTQDGTNGFGATLSVPIVKFWRYRPAPKRPQADISITCVPRSPSVVTLLGTVFESAYFQDKRDAKEMFLFLDLGKDICLDRPWSALGKAKRDAVMNVQLVFSDQRMYELGKSLMGRRVTAVGSLMEQDSIYGTITLLRVDNMTPEE